MQQRSTDGTSRGFSTAAIRPCCFPVILMIVAIYSPSFQLALIGSSRLFLFRSCCGSIVWFPRKEDSTTPERTHMMIIEALRIVYTPGAGGGGGGSGLLPFGGAGGHACTVGIVAGIAAGSAGACVSGWCCCCWWCWTICC